MFRRSMCVHHHLIYKIIFMTYSFVAIVKGTNQSTKAFRPFTDIACLKKKQIFENIKKLL